MINLSNIINIDLLTTFSQGIKETLFDTNKKIKTSYIPNTGNIRSINADGTTITYTKDDGAVGSFTTQDTTVNVQDNLNSTITSDALSANQGRILKEMITSVSGVKFYQTSITVNVPSTNQNGGQHTASANYKHFSTGIHLCTFCFRKGCYTINCTNH